MINLFEPAAGAEELAAISETFAGKWLGTGPKVAEFEAAFASRLGRPAEEFVAVTSCTEGLHQAVSALGLGPDDEVVLPTVSFIGAAHAVRDSGAQVVLCDVNERTLNPSVDHVRAALSSRTSAILVLHFGGDPGALDDIASLASEQSIALIEDAACAIGGASPSGPCGTVGDIGVWSFDPMKTLTTGDGGMVWCRDPALVESVRLSVSLGSGSTGLSRRLESQIRWWEIDPWTTGRRARMNDVAAAIGLAQLDKLDDFLVRRREVYERYSEAFGPIEQIQLPPLASGAAPTFYWVQLRGERERDQLAQHLADRGVHTNFRYWPLHRTALYRDAAPYPGADKASASTLLLPLHQSLSDADVDYVIGVVTSFLDGSQ